MCRSCDDSGWSWVAKFKTSMYSRDMYDIKYIYICINNYKHIHRCKRTYVHRFIQTWHDVTWHDMTWHTPTQTCIHRCILVSKARNKCRVYPRWTMFIKESTDSMGICQFTLVPQCTLIFYFTAGSILNVYLIKEYGEKPMKMWVFPITPKGFTHFLGNVIGSIFFGAQLETASPRQAFWCAWTNLATPKSMAIRISAVSRCRSMVTLKETDEHFKNIPTQKKNSIKILLKYPWSKYLLKLCWLQKGVRRA